MLPVLLHFYFPLHQLFAFLSVHIVLDLPLCSLTSFQLEPLTLFAFSSLIFIIFSNLFFLHVPLVSLFFPLLCSVMQCCDWFTCSQCLAVSISTGLYLHLFFSFTAQPLKSPSISAPSRAPCVHIQWSS